MDYLDLRKQVIKHDFSRMNDMQFKAVTTVKGPVLVLAGAGSGKTTVLVNRIAYLLKYGNAYNSDIVNEYTENDIALAQKYINGEVEYLSTGAFSVEPANEWDILAITFTNKAAGELKDRISSKLGNESNNVWAGTFHSVCGKILRRNAQFIGFNSNFTIYDTDDQKRVIKSLMKDNNIDEKFIPYRYVLNEISSSKDKLITPAQYKANVLGDIRREKVALLFEKYQNRLHDANAMDFDDMIVKTVELLENNPEVLNYYQNKFKYVFVDEYQDTNYAQYMLVSLLSGKYRNLCVVGDDDQSIYRFRGATIENILNFEDEYPDAKVIRLEQNYRSTTTILDAANAVISNNMGRKGKNLWTDNGVGSKIVVHNATDERSEAKYIAETILDNVAKGQKFSDHAVLYRMNSQSNAIENAIARSGISYKVIGGTRFYDRKEIKDVMAYLQVINNTNDDLRLKRIVNEPKRGIGDTTVNSCARIAEENGISLFEVFDRADEFAEISRAANKLKEFTSLIKNFVMLTEQATLKELYEELIEKSGYKSYLALQGPEGEDRIANINQLGTNIEQFEQENEETSLSAFLEEVSLLNDIDAMNQSDDTVLLMTIHAAKGLEFNNVFLAGLEEGIFPGVQSIYGGPDEIEEERRLAYVAITRAKQNLYILHSNTRMLMGSTGHNPPSRFLNEIPIGLCEITEDARDYSYGAFDSGFKSDFGYKRQPSSFVSDYKPKPIKSSFATQKSSNVNKYSIGMRVLHKTFGQGTVKSALPMGSDVMLEIVFDTVGTKKLMAEFAKLTII